MSEHTLRVSHISHLAKRSWQSATVTSWASLGVRLASLTLVLPLLLQRFTPAESAYWLTLGVLANLQTIGDLGFGQAYTRAVAFARGGAQIQELAGERSSGRTTRLQSQGDVLGVLLGTMRPVFRIAACIFFVILSLASLLFASVLHSLPNSFEASIAWVVVAFATAASLASNYYTGYLVGMADIALVKRTEAAVGLAGVCTTGALLVFSKSAGILEIVLAQQAWTLVGTVLYRALFTRRLVQRGVTVTKFHLHVFKLLWPPSWRGGLGVLMSAGLIQASGLVYARLAPPEQSAPFLLALRIIQAISQFSQAPFYSKLPILAQLRAANEPGKQVLVARSGMRAAHACFVIGFLIVGLLAWTLLHVIGSRTQFVAPQLWACVGIAFLIERVGAMHLQLYSTTGHIVWHIANGVTGCLMIGLTLILYPRVGVYAFPLGMAFSYAVFYTAWSVRLSATAFNLDIFRFERTVSFPAVALLACYAAGTALLQA